MSLRGIRNKPRKAGGVPDHSHVVEQVWLRGGWDLKSHEGAGLFCEAVVVALFLHDNNWRHLRKPPHKNNYNGHAVDAVLYLPAGKTADFIVASASDTARVGWGINVGDNYSTVDGVDGYKPDIGNPEPVETHKYNGGGNDTDICDICGNSRFDPVHEIPESKVSHPYDGGESDTGICDVCQRPESDELHIKTPDPKPDPKPDPIDDIMRVSDIVNRVIDLIVDKVVDRIKSEFKL
jgi:hypothetical protein